MFLRPRSGQARRLLPIIVTICALGILLCASSRADASPAPQTAAAPTSTFDAGRLAQPPTVYPPEQADNGAQTYWGMCMDCHGDRGQGLTDDWLASFPPEERDCWESGCHGPDYPENSFEIPQEGVPAIAGSGKLARFSNAFELQRFIQVNMPLFPPGSLTEEEAWSLAAFALKLNDIQPAGLTLGKTNSSAIPIHHKVNTPESEIPGALALSGVLVLAALGLVLQARAKSIAAFPKPNFVHHLHPPSIPALQSRFRYTLGAGGLAVYLSLVLLLTGLLEMYFYIPSPEQAAISVETITTLVPFGNLIRNLHYWSAQLLVVVMTIHLLRVVLTGAYAPPRRFNYLLGLGLLVFILLLDFTGYVLRWDEGIRWALVVGANLLKTIPWHWRRHLPVRDRRRRARRRYTDAFLRLAHLRVDAWHSYPGHLAHLPRAAGWWDRSPTTPRAGRQLPHYHVSSSSGAKCWRWLSPGQSCCSYLSLSLRRSASPSRIAA